MGPAEAESYPIACLSSLKQLGVELLSNAEPTIVMGCPDRSVRSPRISLLMDIRIALFSYMPRAIQQAKGRKRIAILSFLGCLSFNNPACC